MLSDLKSAVLVFPKGSQSFWYSHVHVHYTQSLFLLSVTARWLQQLHSDCTVPCRCDCSILHSCKLAFPQTGKRLFPDVILPWSCLFVCACAFVLQTLIKHLDCFPPSHEIGRHPAEVDHDFSELWTSTLQAHEVSSTATVMHESTDRADSHVSQEHPTVVL